MKSIENFWVEMEIDFKVVVFSLEIFNGGFRLEF